MSAIPANPRPVRPPKPLLRRILISLIALFFLVYTFDFFSFHLRLLYPKLGKPTSSVHRTRLLAVPNKDGKYNFQIDSTKPEEDLPCVRSLFPHANANPCWYVTRHANDPIVM